MRGAWMVAALLATGCKPSLKGWWDLERWTVTRPGDEKPLVRTDAGVVVWQQSGTNAGWGEVYFVMRYDYDPVAFDLVPDADPEQHEQSWSFDEWEKGAPVALEWTEDGDVYVTATFEIVDFDPNAMTMEAASPFGDDATWIWSMIR
jgi:hypothetical protein